MTETEDQVLSPYRARGAVFVHIPRTGGSSIEAALFDPSLTLHLSAAQFRALMAPGEFDRMFSFSVIRCPYERAASIYRFLVQAGDDLVEPALSEAVARLGSFSAFCLALPELHARFHSSHLLTQDHFVRSGGAQIQVDHLIRFDQLAAGFAEVCKRIDITPPELPHRRATRFELAAVMDAPARRAIEDWFAKDLDLLDQVCSHTAFADHVSQCP